MMLHTARVLMPLLALASCLMPPPLPASSSPAAPAKVFTKPGTPPPLRRVEAVARLNEAGIPCGVLIAPILPGISDSDEQLSGVVRACVEAGAVSITSIALHLRPGVRELFMPWLERYRPDLVERYAALYGARNGYLAREEQERVSERVRELVQRFGGCAKSPRESRLTPVPEPRRQAPAPPHEQLPLVG